MAIFRNRLAPTQDLVLAFAACAFPVFVWSILNVLREVPAWVLRLNVWDLIGMLAYTQAFALVESIMIFLAFTVLSIVLPTRILRDKFVAQTGMVVVLSSVWGILAHHDQQIIGPDHLMQLAFWFVVYLVSVGAFYVLVDRNERLEKLVCSLINRLAVVSFVYVGVGFLGVFVAILRNI